MALYTKLFTTAFGVIVALNAPAFGAPLPNCAGRHGPCAQSVTDADNDGVSDAQELLDGTDPLDPGSVKPEVRSPVYALWNGFINIVNILELSNRGPTPLNINISFRNIHGVEVNHFSVSLDPQIEQDVILNNVQGFEKDTYGVVVLEFDGELDGRVFYYRPSITDYGFDFAFGVPFENPRQGESFVGFNTYQPSLDPAEQADLVANWLTVVNLEAQDETYTVKKYDQVGILLSTRVVSIPAFARIDLEGGHEDPGPNHVGLLEIIPSDPTSHYLSQLVRYGLSTPDSDSFLFAFPLTPEQGDGRVIYSAIGNTLAASNWVEVINTLATQTSGTIKYFNNKGVELKEDSFSLPPHGQLHFNGDSVVDAYDTGYVTIIPSVRNSLLSESMFYFRDAASGAMLAMYGTQAREALSGSLIGSYNLFLDMLNFLKIINPGADQTTIDVSVYRTNGTRTTQTILLNPGASVDLSLHDSTAFGTQPDTVGVVTVTSLEDVPLVADLLRVKVDDQGSVQFIAPIELQ